MTNGDTMQNLSILDASEATMIQEVVLDLCAIHEGIAWDDVEPGDWVDVRLRVWVVGPDAEWETLWGAPDFDTNHNGYWGAGTLLASDDLVSITRTARALVEDAIDHAAQVGADTRDDN